MLVINIFVYQHLCIFFFSEISYQHHYKISNFILAITNKEGIIILLLILKVWKMILFSPTLVRTYIAYTLRRSIRRY